MCKNDICKENKSKSPPLVNSPKILAGHFCMPSDLFSEIST